ncbi:MAG: prolipoprotein diacylglyceryl transferase [Chloroflexi bacterium]|nr:prolipoprotein diacylglyceryl transferase [Chloroflexota bacterium]
MHPTIDLNWFELSTYSALVGLGILAGLAATYLLWRGGQHKKAKNARSFFAFLDAAWVVLLAGLVGARTYHVLTHWPYYATRPEQIVQWENLPGVPFDGGLAMRGALIAGVVALALYARLRRLGFWRLADAAACGLALGQAIGWLGALTYGANYGAVNQSRFAIELPDLYGLVQPRFPLQHLEIALFVVVLFCLFVVALRNPRRGTLFLTYLLITSAANFALGFGRGDQSAYIGALRVDQVVDLALGVSALVAWLVRSKLPAHMPAASPLISRTVHGEF